MQVHAELRHDRFEFLDSLLGNRAVFVNIFTQSADFDFLELRHQHPLLKRRNQQNAAVTPDINRRNQLIIHSAPRRLRPAACPRRRHADEGQHQLLVSAIPP